MSEPVDLAGTDPSTEPELGSPWEDLRAYVALPRAGSLALSPDGSWLLAGVQTLTTDGTAYTTALWRIDVDPATGPRRLTRGVEGEQAATFLRDGSVVFTSSRPAPQQQDGDGDDDQALWCLPAQGGEAYQLARRGGGWGSVHSAREADRLVCAVGLHAGIDSLADDQELRARRTKKKVHAILHEGGGVRFWDHDLPTDTVRLLNVDVEHDETTGEARTSREGIRLATDDLGRSLGDHLALSSDGSFAIAEWELHLPRGERAGSLVCVDLATGEVTQLFDEPHPYYEDVVLSRDDRFVATVRHEPSTPTEAPHNFLHLLDLATGEHRDVAADWPRWGTPVAFSPDNQTLYATADEDGEGPVFAITLSGDAEGKGQDTVRRITGHGAFGNVQLAPDGSALYALRTAWDMPGELVRVDPTTGETAVLASPLAYPALPGRLKRVETTASDGTRIPGWLVLPEQASTAQPAPLVLWVHGGPLNSWNAWSWRWCPWLLASQGYAVLLPDPALSTGYGRGFVQRGWGRWGEEPYTDVMALTDAVEARDDVDETRTAMMGGSFGGYMANWIAGHTTRFRAIVSHASLWNLTSFGPTTDAPWFWGRELSPEMMQAHSPHLFASQISTPMLVVHGDKDYRVPISEGLALWWALVSGFDGDPEELPHKFLYFPDENHWVLAPQHAIVWYETVRAFLGSHVDDEPFTRSALL